MENKITGKEYSLSKIFSAEFEYHIPGYQRPYAWTEVETRELFDDLYDFFETQQTENYFLGSIVLIKKETERYADVIDGQQRLTTLTILFAVVADAFKSGEYKEICKNYLMEKGNILQGIEACPRIYLRERDQQFFRDYIQNVRLDDLFKIDASTLKTEAQKHIQQNCAVLKERFQDTFPGDEEIIKFTQFLLNRCFLVAVSTPAQESAFRVFSVMNSRGLDLLPTDIIKSKMIGALAKDEQEKYTKIWEELENATGREGFNEVFTHTRTIFVKERPKKNLLEEFTEYVLKKVTPEELINNYLTPYTHAYMQLKKQGFSSTHNAEEINERLQWLNKTNNYDWMPPAIKFFAEHQNDSDYILWFVKKLERLASYLLVTARDVNERMDRYKWVLVEMESRPNHNMSDPLKSIDLTKWEKEKFMEALDGEIYTMPSQRRNYILQRLDSFVSDRGAIYDEKVFTVEHVLPQNPSKDGEWLKIWQDDEERKYWTNRIANLVPLTRQRNSAAQNYDFATKKMKYFQSKNGTSSYVLTTQVLCIDAWTPEVVKNRQKMLREVFRKNWDLDVPQEADAEKQVFKLAGRGGNAAGYLLEEERFIVEKGSKIALKTASGLQQSYADLRKKLMSDGTIENGIFTKNYIFTSVSAAAAVVLGRSSNGRTEWKTLDGRTIAQSSR